MVAPVRIRSNRLVINGLVSAGILVGLGIWGAVRVDGLAVLPVLLVVGGVALAAVTLFDVPHAVEFDEGGVERVCALRRHRLRWEDITALERPVRGRGAVGAASRGLVMGRRRAHEQESGRRGGLVARVGARRRFLLINRQENPLEREALKSGLAHWAPWLSLPGSAPSGPDPS